MDSNNQQILNDIMNNLGVEQITAKCLLNSGLSTIQDCKDFLNPNFSMLTNPIEYPGFSDVIARTNEAIENQQSVVIYGDYDCDGICATAMLYMFLVEKGVQVNYFIPDRHQDGYGLNSEALENIAEEFFPDLLITVDCGITSVEDVEYAKETLGFDVVVTDHHEIPTQVPDCYIFNPHMSKNGQYPDLCGAGVVLRLIEGLSSFEESKKYYDIAAIATIADVVPLTKDNRIIVKYGLELLNTTPRKGLELLIKSFTKEKIVSSDVAFKLAPRINAVGRMENATRLIDLFKYDDYFVLKTLVDEINEINTKRQLATKKLIDTVEQNLENYDFDKYPVIVLYGKDWDAGVLGIAAAKIASDYNHPTLLLSQQDNKLSGSGRSIKNFNIFECVNSQKDLLVKFGGHPQACGLTIDINNIDSFKLGLSKFVFENYENEVFTSKAQDYYDFNEVNNPIKLCKELEILQPFGEKNPKPTFSAVSNRIHFTRMRNNPMHITYKNGSFQLVGFNFAEKLDVINCNISKRFVFDLSLNIYNNFETAQGIIRSVTCEDYSDSMQKNYLNTSIYEDKSIFKPKELTNNEVDELISNNNYTTAFICYSSETFNNFKANHQNLVSCSYYLDSKCPNNSICFNLSIKESLVEYKNVVFLDRPISLGYIDELILNKDCKVYYVNNDNALKTLAKDLVQYEMLGKIFVGISQSLMNNPKIDMYGIYEDIEKKLNVNYNSFIVAMYIFIDLKILTLDNDIIKINKSVKNPLVNSRLYQLLLGAK